MPRRDGTGPMGRGAMTGRGLGRCTSAGVYGRGRGFGPGTGYGCRRGFGLVSVGFTEKELLMEQKELLESRLDEISKQLDKLSESKEDK